MKKLSFLIVAFVLVTLTACGGPGGSSPAKGFSLEATAVVIQKNIIALGIEPQVVVTPKNTSLITITRDAGFTEAIDLKVEGLPAGVSGVFSPDPVTGDSSFLTLTATLLAPLGSTSVTVKGTTASGAHASTNFNLTIQKKDDTTKPTILSVSPTNNKSGVANNINIVIKFSEPMNKASGQAAYQSSSSRIKPSEVSFNWNAAGTQLTINPNSNLIYKSITFPNNTAANEYIYKITNTATDLAGNSLSNPQTVKFRTLRRVTHTFYSVIDGEVRADGALLACNGICVGDSGTASNAQYKAYFGFSISALPSSLTKIEKATFYAYQYMVQGTPYADLKDGSKRLRINHVYFGSSLTSADFNTPILRDEGNLSTSTNSGYKSNSVITSLKDDYAKKALRGNRSQYMLSFPKVSDFDGHADVAIFRSKNFFGTSKDPKLIVVYLKP